MNILFISPGFPPFIGGGERYAHALALRLSRRGHQVTVLTSDAREERDFWGPKVAAQGPFEAQDEGLRIIRCPAVGFPGGRPALLAWRKAMVLYETFDRSTFLALWLRFG